MYFTVLIFAVILVWVSLTIYRNFNPTESKIGTVVVPIERSFDLETVERLKGRIIVPVDFDASFASTPSPLITDIPKPESTIDPEVNVVPIASSSGDIATSSAN